jgi:hypothetical protein
MSPFCFVVAGLLYCDVVVDWSVWQLSGACVWLDDGSSTVSAGSAIYCLPGGCWMCV